MNEFASMYQELNYYLLDIQSKFIDSFFPVDPSVGPEQYEHDVRAYCILSHAALEQFFEDIVRLVVIKSIENWSKDRRITLPLLTLLSYSNSRLTVDKSDPPPIDDILKEVIQKTENQISNELENNHGAAKKYLQRMLMPVSIDILNDATVTSSLARLASARGQYAHLRKVKSIIAPEDAKKCVNDCLVLCQHVASQAEHHFSVFTRPKTQKRIIVKRLAISSYQS